jgi:release factor glutamine methyltransferase
MANSKKLFDELANSVRLDESRDEIQSIIYLLLEDKFGLSKTDIMTGREIEPVRLDSFTEILDRINRKEPIQYILGNSGFYGRQFVVNSSVLIPRPETELLVRSVIENHTLTPTILDIGTGTGCIAITLALEIPTSEVHGMDINEEALSVARQNAQNLKAKVHFSRWDILSDKVINHKFDVLVSNPPYVTEAEKRDMKSNVLDFEPHLALFVTDEDPLIFYRTIAKKGRLLLKPRGKVFVEINERFGKNVSDLFRSEGYTHIQILKDLDQKDRIVTATLTI